MKILVTSKLSLRYKGQVRAKHANHRSNGYARYHTSSFDNDTLNGMLTVKPTVTPNVKPFVISTVIPVVMPIVTLIVMPIVKCKINRHANGHSNCHTNCHAIFHVNCRLPNVYATNVSSVWLFDDYDISFSSSGGNKTWNFFFLFADFIILRTFCSTSIMSPERDQGE